MNNLNYNIKLFLIIGKLFYKLLKFNLKTMIKEVRFERDR